MQEWRSVCECVCAVTWRRRSRLGGCCHECNTLAVRPHPAEWRWVAGRRDAGRRGRGHDVVGLSACRPAPRDVPQSLTPAGCRCWAPPSGPRPDAPRWSSAVVHLDGGEEGWSFRRRSRGGATQTDSTWIMQKCGRNVQELTGLRCLNNSHHTTWRRRKLNLCCVVYSDQFEIKNFFLWYSEVCDNQ